MSEALAWRLVLDVEVGDRDDFCVYPTLDVTRKLTG